VELLARVDEYEKLLAAAEAPRPKQKKEPAVIAVNSAAAEDFSQYAENLLRDWRFPNLGRVTFSEESVDLVISGEPRGSHGKGVRAITHAAFNLALLQLFQGDYSKTPYPSMVLIDSPLVVYREPDPGEEEFPHTVKQSFYREIANKFKDLQVIILENDEPPTDLEANVVLFSGKSGGRWGFIPLAPEQSA
jgi:hypothetical protein